MDRSRLEEQMAELPIYQYAFVKTKELVFSEKIRWICEHECPMYNHTWACPPAVGSLEECRARCMPYPDALLIATLAELSDSYDMEQALATRQGHEEITEQVHELLRKQSEDILVLSTNACNLCAECTWPNEKCRCPGKMHPCLESYGIVVTDLAEKAGIDFHANGNDVTWFSLLFYR